MPGKQFDLGILLPSRRLFRFFRFNFKCVDVLLMRYVVDRLKFEME